MPDRPELEPLPDMPAATGDIMQQGSSDPGFKVINLLATDYQTYNSPVPQHDFLFQLIGYWIEQGRRLDATHGMSIRVMHNRIKLFEFPNDSRIYRAKAGWEIQVVRTGGRTPIDNHYPDQLRLVWRRPPA